jgi:hypothetical protein
MTARKSDIAPMPGWPQGLSLSAAGAQMGWSARTVRRLLDKHGTAAIGTGRRARITLEDFNRLIEAERQDSARHSEMTAPPSAEGHSSSHLGRQLGRAVRKRLAQKLQGESVVALDLTGRRR